MVRSAQRHSGARSRWQVGGVAVYRQRLARKSQAAQWPLFWADGGNAVDKAACGDRDRAPTVAADRPAHLFFSGSGQPAAPAAILEHSLPVRVGGRPVE